ncbi:MAG: hypothetical protein NVS4B8_27950 [Herpetosiphon sp.]
MMTAQHNDGLSARRGTQGGTGSSRWLRRMIGVMALFAVTLTACGTPASTQTGEAPRATTGAQATSAQTGSARATSAPAGGVTDAATGSTGSATASTASGGSSAASGGASPGVSETEIVIGSWGPQDGPAGAYGVIDRTIAAYFKMVNDQGGINGRKVRFVYENDSYEPAKTVAAVKKLVEEDKVFAMLGGLGTRNNLAVMDYLVQNKVPHLGPATGTTALVQPLKRNIFAYQVNYQTEATLLTQYAVDTAKSQKVAVFYQNDAFGKEGLDAINAELKKHSLAEATPVSYETADTNYSAQALKLQSSGADTVFIWAVPKPGASIIAEMDKIGFKPKLLATAVVNDPSLFKLAGPGAEGLITSAWLPDFTDTSNPKVAEFQAFMKKNMPNEQIGGFAETGFGQAQLMSDVLKRMGKDVTRDGLIKTLEGLQNYTDNLLPSISYSPTDHQGSKAVLFQQARNNQFVKISDFKALK